MARDEPYLYAYVPNSQRKSCLNGNLVRSLAMSFFYDGGGRSCLLGKVYTGTVFTGILQAENSIFKFSFAVTRFC